MAEELVQNQLEFKIDIEEVKNLITERKYTRLKEMLADVNPADMVEIFDAVDKKYTLLLFRVLPKELAAETFAYMDTDTQRSLIEAFTDLELREIVNELFLDDTVDIIEEMPAYVVDKILRNVDSQTRKTINDLLHYPKDSAGSIMTTEYVALKKNMTVEQAFAHIRKHAVDKETIYTCYVTDNRKLMGIVTVKELLLASYEDIIGDIMETNVIAVDTHEDQEVVANMFDKYDLMALPVVDKEYRVVGIITVDDAMEVIIEEHGEDIEAMAAILPSDKSYMQTGVFETWKKRIPWLLLLMISSTFTGMIIQSFESALAGCVVLTAFMPMLMGTGGNAGSQASVTIIRGLSLDEIEYKDTFKIMWKELRISIVCGLTLGVAGIIKILLVDNVSLTVGIVVALTLFVTVIMAKIIGCTLPILVKRLGFDPAVVVSPFITTVVDALSLFLYFQIASMLLNL
ncbi:MAG: magnesium transporter [Lachnospiraceae bacterium]|nr:magnesium transporter [Lachnospiraceae bacterium]